MNREHLKSFFRNLNHALSAKLDKALELPYKSKGECSFFIGGDKKIKISKASLDDVRKFLPETKEENIDVLPVAFNAFVANRVNANDDVVDTQTALNVVDTFIHKPINIEHERKNVVGVITNFGFSKFGTDEELTREEVENTDEPFNIVLGGFLWKLVSNIDSVIEETNDETSENFEAVSASWEIGFSDYDIVALADGQKNIKDGEIITDESEVNKLDPLLRANGGSGKTKDGKRIYRKASENVLGLGIGLTENPAADVKGVATASQILSEEVLKDFVKNIVEEAVNSLNNKKVEKNVEKISQSKKTNVKENKNVMKLTDVEQITDEFLTEAKASATDIRKFIHDKFDEFAKEVAKEKEEKKTALQEANKKYEELKENAENATKELDEVRAQLETLKAAEEERKKEETFQERMASIDETYEIGKEERAIISARIKDMDDTDFKQYEEELKVLLASKNKEAIAAQNKEKENETSNSDAKEAAKQAKANANPENGEIPNAIEGGEQSLLEKYREAFSTKHVKVTLR